MALYVPRISSSLEHIKRDPHGGHNGLVDGPDLLLGPVPVLPLLHLKLIPFVQPLLLMPHQQQLTDGTAVLPDLRVGFLVILYDLAQPEGVFPAVLHKVLLDPFRGPRQLAGHPRLDLLVQRPYPLFEEGQLLGLEAGDDGVVVPHDEEDVLSPEPQVVALAVHVSCIVGDLEPQPLPVAHLPEEFEEGPAELELKHAGLLR